MYIAISFLLHDFRLHGDNSSAGPQNLLARQRLPVENDPGRRRLPFFFDPSLSDRLPI